MFVTYSGKDENEKKRQPKSLESPGLDPGAFDPDC
jgi:hypothetical protein